MHPLALKSLVSASFVVATLSLCSFAFSQEMSLAEQQEEAQRLKDLCNNDTDVQQQREAAQSGSMAAAYLGAAAMIQCFYDNVDSRYPAEQKEKWLDAINQNKQKAADLGQ